MSVSRVTGPWRAAFPENSHQAKIQTDIDSHPAFLLCESGLMNSRTPYKYQPRTGMITRGGGARGGESKCNVLTRFDAFVLIVADIGGPTHGHTDGYYGLGLGLNRYVKICMCYRSNSVYTRPGSAYIYAFIYKAQA